MAPIYQKIIALVLLVIGESLAIYAEMIAAKSAHIDSASLLNIFLQMFLVVTVAGGFLLAGYIFGFNAFKNIWIVSAASITSILIVEPILAWTIFQQTPTTGAVTGLVLGALGLFISVFF